MQKFIYTIILVLACFSAEAQQIKTMSLNDVLNTALSQSPDAYFTKLQYQSAFSRYRSYKAGLLPSVSFSATLPDINRSIEPVVLADGSEVFVNRSIANTMANLQVNQNIGLTGGRLFFSSGLQRIDQLGDNKSTSYLSSPFAIGYSQPLFGFNSFKWDRKIEPIRHHESKKQYMERLEDIKMETVSLYYDLALAQINRNMAEVNYQNNDTLFKIAQGRYNMGTIAQNELLQIELNLLNSRNTLKKSRLDTEMKQLALLSFLGYNENLEIVPVFTDSIPHFRVPADSALQFAVQSNAKMMLVQRNLAESERNLAQTRSETRFNATLFVSYGQTGTSSVLQEAYNNPEDKQRLSVGLQVPILDWGKGREQLKVAKSQLEMTQLTNRQALADFNREVLLTVKRFNLNGELLETARKADIIAHNKYKVVLQRFYIGKINVTDLNIAANEKDGAKRSYIAALRDYWIGYYTVRKLTAYDFEKNTEIEDTY